MKIFIAHSIKDAHFVKFLEDHLRSNGHEVIVPASLRSGGNLLSEISASIRSADVLLAIVTSANANIYYELGLAAGASVPLLIIAQARQLLPFDLVSVPFVQLTEDPLRDAQVIIRRVEDFEGIAANRHTRWGSGEEALSAAVRDPSVLEAIPPQEFERLVAELFRERGLNVTQTPRSKDGGVDLVLETQGGKAVVLVQVKKLSMQSRVSVEAVRQFLGVTALFGAASGVLVSTSGFTAAAVALAAGTPIVLRTLEEVLAAKSSRELLAPGSDAAKTLPH